MLLPFVYCLSESVLYYCKFLSILIDLLWFLTIIKRQMKHILFLSLALIVLAGCNKNTADKYMQQAKAAVEQKKITDAVKAYEALVNEFPKDSLAPEALYNLGALYQNKLVPGYAGTASTEKAVSVYKSVYDKYPDSKQAPNCLFMCGFLQSNELNKYADATSSYNTFLQKYPKNEMAPAAKYELDNMGLTPGQVLEQKISINK